MERDIRRDRGQWKGCHSLQRPARESPRSDSGSDGGLKMGQTYYYYYEVNGASETYNSSMPTTNTCPYLPGQTVNTMEVPVQKSHRYRSASCNSARITDYMTLNPEQKFVSPRAPPPVPEAIETRPSTASLAKLNHKRSGSARSLSPSNLFGGKARRILGLRASSRLSSGQDTDCSDVEDEDNTIIMEPRLPSRAGSDGSRSRSISPEALRRFLAEDDDVVTPPASAPKDLPKMWIPEQITEENEDDLNFATSAVSESVPFTTLSPPPFQRSNSVPLTTQASSNGSAITVVLAQASSGDIVATPTIVESPLPLSDTAQRGPLRSRFSLSTVASSLASPTTSLAASSPGRGGFSFFDDTVDDIDEDDDDESLPANDELCGGPAAYCLPQPALTSSDQAKRSQQLVTSSLESPALVARNGQDVPLGNASLLSSPSFDSGLEDLLQDIGWIVDVIQPREI